MIANSMNKITSRTMKTVLFTGLILTLMIPVAGITVAYAGTVSINDADQKQACEKKVEKVINGIHKQFDEEKAKDKVLSSDSVESNSEGKTPQYFGTGFEGTFDEKCDLEKSDTYVNLLLDEYEKSGTTFKDFLKVEIDDKYDVREVTKETKIDRQNGGLLVSQNWTGYTMYDLTGTSTYNDVEYARAEFAVPNIYDPSTVDCTGTGIVGCALSVWSGLSRDYDGNTLMAQTGIAAECEDENCSGGETYHMFTEMVGTPHQVYCSSAVSPGDDILSITSHGQNGQTHTLSMWSFNYDTGKSCSATKSSTSSSYQPRYAQYITERPSSGSSLEHLPGFADFDIKGKIIRSNGIYEGISPTFNEGDYYVHWMYHNGQRSGTLNVSSEAVSSTSDKFLVNYRTSEGT